MIVLAIKSFFFFRADSYSLVQKLHISYFFLFFCKVIIKVVYAILAVAINNLEVHLGHLNLSVGKSEIRFEPLAQKEETSKQTTSALYY